MRNIIIFSSRLFRVQQMTYWCSTLRGGCIGEYCHHSEELTGNIGWSLERSDGGGQYCTSIPRNDDSIHQYIWPRATVFTLLSCQLLSMCHFSTVYPPHIFQYVGGYILQVKRWHDNNENSRLGCLLWKGQKNLNHKLNLNWI